MKLVVDANILFSFFWKDCFTKRILMNGGIELIAPEFALEELEKYRGIIMEKVRLVSDEFDAIRRSLVLYVDFVSLNYYKRFLKKAVGVCPDENDIDYFALAMKDGLRLWSNDKRLKEQGDVKVLNTGEVMELLG